MSERVLSLDPYKLLHLRRTAGAEVRVVSYDNENATYLTFPDGSTKGIYPDVYGDPEDEREQSDIIECWLREALTDEQREWLLDESQKLSREDFHEAYKLELN